MDLQKLGDAVAASGTSPSPRSGTGTSEVLKSGITEAVDPAQQHAFGGTRNLCGKECICLEEARVPRWMYVDRAERWMKIRSALRVECGVSLHDLDDEGESDGEEEGDQEAETGGN